MKYYNMVSNSEAKYLLNSTTGLLKKREGNVQSSYNIDVDIFKALCKHRMIVQDSSFEHARKSQDGDAYVLNSNIKITLGEGALWLVGDEFKKVELKFVG